MILVTPAHCTSTVSTEYLRKLQTENKAYSATMITPNQSKPLRVPVSPVFPVICSRFWGAGSFWQAFSSIESQTRCRGKGIDLYPGFGEKGDGRQEEETGTDQAMRLTAGER